MNRTTTKIIIGSVFMLCVLIAGYVYLIKSNGIPPDSTVETATTTPTSFVKETDTLSVNIVYPTIPGNGTDVAATNEYLKKEIDVLVEGFEKDAAQTNQDIELPSEIKSTVRGTPSIEEKNERYVALFMGMEWYFRGSAHPSHSIETYVYDYQTDRLAFVPDFFKKESNYLKVLSALSQEDLLAQDIEGDMEYIYDKEMVEEGTRPILENFSNIIPLKDGLAIYFDEYQVASYAAGPQQVVIPYTKLKDIINPDGVLGMYIQ